MPLMKPPTQRVEQGRWTPVLPRKGNKGRREGKWSAWLSKRGGKFEVSNRTVVECEKGRSSYPVSISGSV